MPRHATIYILEPIEILMALQLPFPAQAFSASPVMRDPPNYVQHALASNLGDIVKLISAFSAFKPPDCVPHAPAASSRAGENDLTISASDKDHPPAPLRHPKISRV